MTTHAPVLVTGASGFIAGHTVLQLVKKGYRVRGTIRNLAKADALKAKLAAAYSTMTKTKVDWDQQLELVAADLNHDLGWQEAVTGCQAVIHIASPFPAKMPKDANEIINPAREGTLRVLQACEDAQVSRVVLTSSVVAVGYPAKPASREFTEKDWSYPNESAGTNAYTRSKVIAEQAAWEFVNNSGNNQASQIKLTTICPSLVCGPVIDISQSTSVNMVRDIVNGDIPVLLPFGVSIVDVRDVARAHILALENDVAIGQRYLCTEAFMWMKDIAEFLKSEFPEYAERIPKKEGPVWLLKLMSLFNDDLKGIKHELGCQRTFSSAKLKQELNWQPISAKQTLIDTVKALQEHDGIKPDQQVAA